MTDPWPEAHKAKAKASLDRSLCQAIAPHLELVGAEGFLTRDEIAGALLAAVLTTYAYEPSRASHG